MPKVGSNKYRREPLYVAEGTLEELLERLPATGKCHDGQTGQEVTVADIDAAALFKQFRLSYIPQMYGDTMSLRIWHPRFGTVLTMKARVETEELLNEKSAGGVPGCVENPAGPAPGHDRSK